MTWRVLDTRESDGIRVVLAWESSANELRVRVRDTKEGRRFDLRPESGAEALHAFRHPMAHERRGEVMV